MTLNTYGHVIEELVGLKRQAAEDAIHKARDELVPLTYPEEPRTERSSTPGSLYVQELRGEPTRADSNRGPLLRVTWQG
jgi:hypothetical protein